VWAEGFFTAGMVGASAAGAASELGGQPVMAMATITAIIPMKRVAG
jgi:hypothetical protein